MTEEPGCLPDDLLRGLSLRRRVGHVVAGLGGLTAAALIAQVWATEPQPLPVRTRVAFAVMIVIGLAWAAVGTWALARRPLFAVDRVVSGWLAVAFTTLLTAGLLLLAVTRAGGTATLAAAGAGLALIAAAVTVLVRARAYRRTLLARRRTLEHRRD